MTDPSQVRRKSKITYTATLQGVERAKNGLQRLGFESKINFAESQLLSRSTVTKFFLCQPLQLDSFKKICNALKLNWKEIAGISEEEQLGQLAINDCSSPNTNERVDSVQTPRRQVTVIDKSNETIIAAILLEGDINSVSNLRIIASILREYSGETIKIIDIKTGSIKLIVEGSLEDIKRLVLHIKSGELKEVSGFPVEDIQILSESSADGESDELNDKWCSVQEIVSQAVEGRNFSDADLSDADLRHTNLSNADLSNADLSNADLSNANLSNANLSNANLRGANLRGANLRGANLISADLCSADLCSADLIGANLFDADLRGTDLCGAKLCGTDLIGANLSGDDLIGADLIGADLSSANLSGANLSSANLSSAKLSGADLIRAKLSGADLRGADLRGADLCAAADVEGALLGFGLGLTDSEKKILESRGAIFDEGERRPVNYLVNS